MNHECEFCSSESDEEESDEEYNATLCVDDTSTNQHVASVQVNGSQNHFISAESGDSKKVCDVSLLSEFNAWLAGTEKTKKHCPLSPPNVNTSTNIIDQGVSHIGTSSTSVDIGEPSQSRFEPYEVNHAYEFCSSESDEEADVTFCVDDTSTSQLATHVQENSSHTHFISADMQQLQRADTRELMDLGSPSYSCSHCGAIFWYAERVQKQYKASNPRFNLCCKDGKVRLPLLRASPPLLEELMDYEGRHRSNNFRANIRQTNLFLL